MKSTGILRKVDQLGRIVIPKGLRKKLHIQHNTPLEIFTKDDYIYLLRYEPSCYICGTEKGDLIFKDQSVCKKCIDYIKEVSD